MRHGPAQSEPDGRVLPRIGIVVACGEDDLGKALFARIVRMEIQRRMPGSVVRCFGLERYAQPQGLDGGEPLEPMGTWSPERTEELADEFDCVIVGGGDLDEVSRRRLEEAGLDRKIEVIPDPAPLAARHFDREVSEKRLEYLRLMRWYPPRGRRALVVQAEGDAALLGAALTGPIGRILKGRDDLSVVVAEIASSAGGEEFGRLLGESLPEQVYRIPSEVEVEDWVAALSAAEGFIGTSHTAAVMAMAFRKPVVVLNLEGRFDPAALGWTGPGAALVGEVKEVADAFEQAEGAVAEGAADEGPLEPLRERLDRHLDRVAEIAREAWVRRGRGEEQDRPDFEGEAALLRTAHDVLSRRLAAERSLFADRAASWPEVARLEAEVSRLDEELRSLKSRRLYRYSAPLLSLYGRLRRWLGLKR